MPTFLRLAPCWCTALFTACLWATDGAAEEPTGRYEAPEVVISASRLSGELAAPARDLLIVDADAIEARAATSVTELLGGLPGINIGSRGPLGVQGDLEVDGSTFSQVLVLVDGIRVNDPQTDHHSLNLPLAPADLERVEVLYGGGSSVHGPDALGGVVNLVPRALVRPRVDVAARWGSSLDDGTTAVATDAGLRHGWSGGWGTAWVTAGKRRSDGHRDGTDFDEERGFAYVRLPMAGGVLSVQGGIQDKVFGARDFYAAFPSREWTTAQLASATFQHEEFTVRAYGRRHRDRFVLIASDPSVYENRHRSLLLGAEGYGRLAVAGGSLVTGGELGRESVDSSNLGDHGRVRAGLFGEYGRRLGDLWQVTAGLRADHHEAYGWEASPSLSAARRLGEGRIYASATRSYRAPSYTETFYTDRAHIGNPDLRSERAWQLESGASVPLAGGRLDGAVFARRETDLVDYVRAADYATPEAAPAWEARNLGQMETVGLRLRASRRWRRAEVEIGYTLIDKERTLAAGLESKYVFSHPTSQVAARVRHDLPLAATAEWQLAVRERLAPLVDYHTIDLTVSRRFAPGRMLLRVRNVTDERYEAIRGVPMPGRWFGVETQVDL